MLGYCDYCGKKLPTKDVRVDMRFCDDDHRINYHNQKRAVKAAWKKASKAIEQLQELADENKQFSMDAKEYLRRLHLQIKQDADS